MGRHASPAAHAVRLGGVVLFFAACVALRGHTFLGVGGGAGRRLGDLEPSEHSAGSVSSIDQCLLLMNDTINSAANVRKNEGQLVCQKDYCEDLVGGYINYMKFHVCTLQGQPFVGYALLVAWLCVQFYLLADTADAFFVPVLQQIVALFQVQPRWPASRSCRLATVRPTCLRPWPASANPTRRTSASALCSARACL